jgi:hypothetical protein
MRPRIPDPRGLGDRIRGPIPAREFVWLRKQETPATRGRKGRFGTIGGGTCPRSVQPLASGSVSWLAGQPSVRAFPRHFASVALPPRSVEVAILVTAHSRRAAEDLHLFPVTRPLAGGRVIHEPRTVFKLAPRWRVGVSFSRVSPFSGFSGKTTRGKCATGDLLRLLTRASSHRTSSHEVSKRRVRWRSFRKSCVSLSGVSSCLRRVAVVRAT